MTTTTTAWRAYSPSADFITSEEIVRYLPLVRNVMDRIKLNLPAVDADDLYSVGIYSVGIAGLIAAVRKFDPEQGSTFASYADMRIRGSILDELRRMAV